MSSEAHKTLSVAVVSGKGGVGKTNLALNLGFALHRAGHPVLLMDCDLGLANLDVLLGLAPEKNLQDLLQPGVESRDVVAAIEEGGFDFLPSASGAPELIDLDEDLRGLLFDKLTSILGQYDYLVMDLGAGISRTVLSFAAMAQERLVVITPEPTSLTDGYALIKVLKNEYQVERFHVTVNMADSRAQGEKSFERLAAACKRFLGLDLEFLGAVRNDPAVVQAVIRQTPLLKYAPTSNAGKDILNLAVKLKRLRDKALPLLPGKSILSNIFSGAKNTP
jgi:flagellar biosynthesis protein FlhG